MAGGGFAALTAESQQALLAMLACPACRSALRLDTTELDTTGLNAGLDTGLDAGDDPPGILCQGCGQRFAVVDGIPVLIAAGE